MMVASFQQVCLPVKFLVNQSHSHPKKASHVLGLVCFSSDKISMRGCLETVGFPCVDIWTSGQSKNVGLIARQVFVDWDPAVHEHVCRFAHETSHARESSAFFTCKEQS